MTYRDLSRLFRSSLRAHKVAAYRIAQLERALERVVDESVRDMYPHSSAWRVSDGAMEMARAVRAGVPADDGGER